METEFKAQKPFTPSRLVATRIGDQVDVQIYPVSPSIPGAGTNPPPVPDYAPPFQFLGDFRVVYNSAEIVVNSDSFTIIFAGNVEISVSSRLNSYESGQRTVSVPNFDGKYISGS